MADTTIKKWNSTGGANNDGAWEDLYPETTVSQLIATGDRDSTTFLRGDGVFSDTLTGNLTIEDSALRVGDISNDNYLQIQQVGNALGFTFQHSNASAIQNLQGNTNQALVLGDVDNNNAGTLLGASILQSGSWTKKFNLTGEGELYIGSTATDQVWHNGNFEPIVDNLDILPAYSNSNEDTVSYNTTERAIELQSNSDNSMGLVYPALKTESGVSWKISFSIKASASSTSGVYFRIAEYDSALPDGKTHISHDASHSEVQEDTRQIMSFHENQAIGTSWEQHSFFYTPTSTAVWFSPLFLNWSGLGTNALYVKNFRIFAIQEDSADANTLDGIDSTQFLRSDESDTMTGNLTISAGTSGDAVLTIEADTDNNDENDNPHLQFQQDGGNTIAKAGITGNAGEIFQNSLANSAYFGNEEAASVQFYTNGLARLTIREDGDVGINTNGPASGYKLDVNGKIRANNDIVATNFVDYNNGNYYVNPASTSVLNALTVGGSDVLTTASTIDADTLDSIDSTQFLRSDTDDTASGNYTFTGYHTGNTQFYGTDTSGSYANAPIEIREVNLVTTNQSSEAYAPELAFHWGGRSQTSIWLSAQGKLNLAGNQTGEVLTSNSTIDADTLGGVAIGSLLQKTGGTMTGDINFQDDGEGIGFYGDNAIKKVSGTGMVITTDSTRALDILLQLERGAGGTKYKVYHEGNKPTASDVGAATVGHTHTDLVSVSGDSMTGDLQLDKDGTTDVGSHGIVFQANTSLDGLGDFTRELNIDSAGNLNYNGNTIFHEGNDGSASGLHADLLDGQQGSYYLDYNNFTNTPSGGGEYEWEYVDVVNGGTSSTLTYSSMSPASYEYKFVIECQTTAEDTSNPYIRINNDSSNEYSYQYESVTQTAETTESAVNVGDALTNLIYTGADLSSYSNGGSSPSTVHRAEFVYAVSPYSTYPGMYTATIRGFAHTHYVSQTGTSYDGMVQSTFVGTKDNIYLTEQNRIDYIHNITAGSTDNLEMRVYRRARK